MNEDDKNYIRRELGKARPLVPANTVKVKAWSDAGESRWVSVDVDTYERMIIAAAGPDTPTVPEQRSL